MHPRLNRQFSGTTPSMMYGILPNTQNMAPFTATTHLPPAVLTQFQNMVQKTPSMHTQASINTQPSFASTITPRFSSTGWQSKSDLHERLSGTLRQRSRTTGYSEVTKVRGYSPPANPEHTRELTELKEMLKESESITEPGEEYMWKHFRRYSRPGGNDAQKNPSPLVSGPPPSVTITVNTAPPQRPMVPEESPWFGADEQAALNEYYKNHPFPGQWADVNVTPSHLLHRAPTISISRESHKTIVNTDQGMNQINVETLHKVIETDEAAPACMKCFSTLSTTPSPFTFSPASNNSPTLSRVASTSTSQNAEKTEKVVFLRNYRGSQSPYNSLSSQSSELIRTTHVKKSPPLPNLQYPSQHRNTAKVEFLQVRNPQNMATYESARKEFEKMEHLQPRAPIYHYVYPMQDQQGQPLQEPIPLQPQPPPQFSYNSLGGLLSPAPSPNTSPPPSIPKLPQGRSRSPPSQRPRAKSYIPPGDQPAAQVWSTQPEAFPLPHCPLPSQPPQVLPTPPMQLSAPMSSFQLPPTPPTPPNEPHRFKHVTWPSNTMWVPGERPQGRPTLVPAQPNPEPPRFLPMSSAVPVSVNPFPPVLFNTTYPGFEGFNNM